MDGKAQVIEKNEGTKIDFRQKGYKLYFGDDDLILRCDTRQREHPVHIDICADEDGNLVTGVDGNVWEWLAGMRLVRGELQFIPYNNAADPTVDMSATSTAWKAIKAAATGYNDLYITPNGAGTTSGSVKLDFVSNHWQYAPSATSTEDSNRSAAFAATTASGLSDFCKMYLQAMALLPEDGDTDYGSDNFWANNGAEERLPFCGGLWYSSAGAGVFSLSFDELRSHVYPDLGFRTAFVNL